MSIVEDLRKLLQDLVAPELRALGQKLDSQNEVMRSRFDAAEKITKVLDDRQIDRVQQLETKMIDRVQQLETKMIDRFQHVDTKMIDRFQHVDMKFQQLDMKITMSNELTQRDLKSIQTSVSSLANTVERLLSERRHQPAPVPGTVIARRLEETSSPSEAPRPATTAED